MGEGATGWVPLLDMFEVATIAAVPVAFARIASIGGVTTMFAVGFCHCLGLITHDCLMCFQLVAHAFFCV